MQVGHAVLHAVCCAALATLRYALRCAVLATLEPSTALHSSTYFPPPPPPPPNTHPPTYTHTTHLCQWRIKAAVREELDGLWRVEARHPYAQRAAVLGHLPGSTAQRAQREGRSMKGAAGAAWGAQQAQRGGRAHSAVEQAGAFIAHGQQGGQRGAPCGSGLPGQALGQLTARACFLTSQETVAQCCLPASAACLDAGRSSPL